MTKQIKVKRLRKRPVVIEAFQITTEVAISYFIDKQPLPFGITLSGSYHPERRTVSHAYAVIDTKEGQMKAGIGDWIIRGVEGDLYTCKADILELTYDEITLTNE